MTKKKRPGKASTRPFEEKLAIQLGLIISSLWVSLRVTPDHSKGSKVEHLLFGGDFGLDKIDEKTLYVFCQNCLNWKQNVFIFQMYYIKFFVNKKVVGRW